MKKLFEKDAVLFAVLWIVLYVVSFSFADGISEAVGMPKSITVCAGLGLSVVLVCFLHQNQLCGYAGLVPGKRFAGVLGYIPLIAITTLPLWCGMEAPESVPAAVLGVVSMCFVGFLEEVIFRGLLFTAMRRSNLKTAVIVSSLTFGVGHAVNLLMGAPVLDTLLQLVYASAVGFCYTAVFHVGGSIIPCILSHGLVNSLDVFASALSEQEKIAMAAVQTVLGLGYGIWLFWKNRKGARNT